MDVDLFGPVPPENQPRTTRAGKNAYPALPGTGPAGMKCRDCEHSIYKPGVAGSYPKCNLMRARWTGGRGTDIRMRSPACSKFEPATR